MSRQLRGYDRGKYSVTNEGPHGAHMSLEHAEIPAKEQKNWKLAAIPNSLTVIRLVLGLVFLFLPPGARLPAFLVAAATEFLDGVLARLLRATSLTGQVLDPIADKLFVLAVLLSLWQQGVLSWWALLLVAARDIAVFVGSLTVATTRGITKVSLMTPRVLGKLATTAQLFLLLFGVAMEAVPPLLLAVTVALSVAAGVDYVRRFL